MEGRKASVELEDFLYEIQQVRFENDPYRITGEEQLGLFVYDGLVGFVRIVEEFLAKNTFILTQY